MKRNIVVCILLSFVTCGIYGIYWMIKLNDEIHIMAGDTEYTSGGMVFLFTLITCGIYGWFWMFNMGKAVDKINNRDGDNTAIIYLILSILGVGIINYCLMQDTVNKNAFDAE